MAMSGGILVGLKEALLYARFIWRGDRAMFDGILVGHTEYQVVVGICFGYFAGLSVAHNHGTTPTTAHTSRA